MLLPNATMTFSMQIQLNGEPYTLSDGQTLAELIEQMSLTGRRIAVELNHDIVPRSQHATTLLKDGDHIEVVQAIGGG